MIFRKSFQQELSRTFSATLVVLATVVMTMMLIRTLGLASKGSVNPEEIFLIMAYSVMGHVPTILALSLFITAVSTLARMIGDSEVAVWFSSGQSLASFAHPLLAFALPIFLTIAVMAFMIWPFANEQMQNMRVRFEQRGDLERIVPGEFQESSNGKRVIYIGKESADSARAGSAAALSARHIFMAYFDQDKELITSAQSGHLEDINGYRYIVLTTGQQLTLNNINQDVSLTEFESMGNLVGASSTSSGLGPPNTRSTLTLLQDSRLDNQGELSWRIGIVLAALNLILIALVSASTKPRAARSGHLMFAMLVFVSYYNFINITQNWIASGRIGFVPAVLLLHGSIFGISLVWLARRHYYP